MTRALRRFVALAGLACAIAGCTGAGRVAPSAAELVAPETASGRVDKPLAVTTRDMVVAANPRAVEAGVATLARGGSAVDAAIAVQLVLNLVEPQSSGIGGGGFMLHFDRGAARLSAYDGRETAPAAATPDMLLDAQGRPLSRFAAIDGGLSVGTPGLLRMLELAHRRHGRLAWASLFEPAITLAERGFEISPRMAASIAASAARICRQAPANAYFLKPGGCAAKDAGTRLANPEFAATLRAIAAGGADAFYTGPLARAVVDQVRSHPTNPGRLALDDLAGYRARTREAVCSGYRGTRVCGMPPPSSGAIAILQILGILQHFDLPAMAPGGLDAVHLVAEAMRLAYADRAKHVADSDFVAVPLAGLLDPAYLASRARLIRMERSMGVPAAGEPAGAVAVGDDRSAPLPSTTHLSIVDGDGNVVSMTTSIENGFGSLQMVDGFLLNNQLTDFSPLPADDRGRPAANRIEPGKRPRSTMAPLIVFDATGRVSIVLGSPGGVAIAAYVSKTLIGMIDWNMTIQQAIDAPNFIAETTPTTWLERGTALEGLADGLRARGHRVALVDLNSGAHGIAIGARANPLGAASAGPAALSGGADPRREGVAMGTRGQR